MKFSEIQELEKNAEIVWVISPNLYFDCEDKSIAELVDDNLRENTIYRYIVPTSDHVQKNVTKYKRKFKISEADVKEMFLFLPETDWTPFMHEIAIYNPHKASRKVVAAPHGKCATSDEMICFNKALGKEQTTAFKALWKKYKRTNP